jgi:putative transposase
VELQFLAKRFVIGYGEGVDVCLQSSRNGAKTKRFFKRILKRSGGEPRSIATDKLKSYGAADL